MEDDSYEAELARLWAAHSERVNEAGLDAEKLYERIVGANRDEAIDLLREILRDMAETESLYDLAKEMLVDVGKLPPEMGRSS